MGRTANARQTALAKARQRRLELDAERDARDRRVEEATAEGLVLLDQRAEAERVVVDTNTRIGDVLRRLLADGVGLDGAAALVDLDVAEVRKLTKLSSPAQDLERPRPDQVRSVG